MEALESRVLLSSVALDQTFGTAGKVLTDIQNNDHGIAVHVQPDGKVLVAGHVNAGLFRQNAGQSDFLVVRYNGDGTLDEDFGGDYDGAAGRDGYVRIDFTYDELPNTNPGNASDDYAFELVVDGLGRIVVVGECQQDFAIARLTPNGDLDPTFGPGPNGLREGKQTINFGSNLEGANSVAIDEFQRIVVGGRAFGAGQDFAAARLQPDGEFMGSRRLDFNLGEDSARGLAIDSQGRIVMIGFTFDGADDTTVDLALLRILPDRSPDPTFDGDSGVGNGFVRIDFSEGDTVWSELTVAITFDDQDRMVLVGSAYKAGTSGSDRDIAVARVLEDGRLDTTFNPDGDHGRPGTAIYDLGGTGDGAIDVQIDPLDPQGRIVISGSTTVAGIRRMALVRLLPDGTRDVDFDGDGLVTANFGGVEEAGGELAFDSKGRIVVTGSSDQGGAVPSWDVTLARFVIADAGGPYTVTEGQSLTLDASASSYSPDDPLTYHWDINGDGHFDATGVSPTLSWEALGSLGVAGSGSFTVSVHVHDGAVSTGAVHSAALTVQNVAPTVTAVSASSASIREGQSVTVSGTFTDPALGLASETFTGTALWSDGASTAVTVSGGTFSTSRTFADDDPTGTPADAFTVTVTISDDGGSDTAAAGVTVENAAPADLGFENVTFGEPAGPTDVGGVRGQTLLFSGGFTDVGTLDTHSAMVDWGDGSPAQPLSLLQGAGGGTITGGHVYASAGTFTVTVTVTDDDGGTAVQAVSVVVADAALLPDTCHAGQLALYVGGTAGADDIRVTADGGTGGVEVVVNGLSQGTFAPTGRVVVFAQAGDDDVQVAGGITHAVWVYGGAGDDRLKSRAGHDVLLGEDGDDLLQGGDGRDLLVGGNGADRIMGNADDDIMVAGNLHFTDRDAAICAIMAEWTSSRTYQERVENLTGVGTGGANGAIYLKRDETVVDDADDSRDVLTGSGGDDWLFLWSPEDKATGPKKEVFANDLDWILNEF